MNGWVSKALATIVAGAALLGVSGLIVAGTMRADVDAVKKRSEADHAKIAAVAEAVSALEAQVNEVKEQVTEQRREQRADTKDLDRKLDRILERLP
jgi:outer membrane murein-binding lipoprotein Lpp